MTESSAAPRGTCQHCERAIVGSIANPLYWVHVHNDSQWCTHPGGDKAVPR